VADGINLDPELLLGPALLGSQVEEVVLLAVECVKALGVPFAECIAEAVVGFDCLVYARADLGKPRAR
jgi:hypothetical protein